MQLTATGLLTAAAGCSGDTDDEGATTGTATSTTTGEGSDGTALAVGESKTLKLGDDRELTVTPTSASLRDVLVHGVNANIYSETPEESEQTYLTIAMAVENTGSEVIGKRDGAVFNYGGEERETAYTNTYDSEGFPGYFELEPGESATSWLVYTVTPSEPGGRLVVEYEMEDRTSTAEWPIDIQQLDRERYDFEPLDLGERQTIGSDIQKISFSVVSVEETQSYPDETGEDSPENQADEGEKFVIVTLSAESTGEQFVKIPSVYDIQLVTEDNSNLRAEYDGTREQYESEVLSPGTEKRGVLLFRIPETVSSYEIRTEFTSDISVSWRP